MEKKIHIFFTINNSYCCYLATAIASILYNGDSNHEYFFHILDGGISEDNKRKINLLKKIKDFDIEYLAVNQELFSQIPQSSQAHISNETNYRFLISSLKKNIDKCIFIDADLVFVGDISKLWNIDVDKYYMAAVTDQAPLVSNSWAEKFPLPQGYIYVNTGVTLMNLKKWRQDKVENKFFENADKYSDLLMFPDQDVLNITLAPHVKYLAHCFNAMPVQKYQIEEQEKEAFTDPVVIHWAGRNKPWVNPTAKYADIFWQYAKMTPFYEEIIYKNTKNSSVSSQILIDALCRSKNTIKYWRYKFLSKITFGNMHKHYIKKKKELKERLKRVRKFLKK